MVKDKTLEQFLQKSPDARKKMWFNAMKIARSGKGDVARAQQMLDEYEAIELASDRPEATEPVGDLMFEPHSHGFVSFGYAQSEMVTSIRKTEQHRHEGNRVYQVNVLGQTLPSLFRSVDEARETAAQFHANQRGGPA